MWQYGWHFGHQGCFSQPPQKTSKISLERFVAHILVKFENITHSRDKPGLLLSPSRQHQKVGHLIKVSRWDWSFCPTESGRDRRTSPTHALFLRWCMCCLPQLLSAGTSQTGFWRNTQCWIFQRNYFPKELLREQWQKKGNWVWDISEWEKKWEEEAKEREKHQKKGLTECGVAGISSRFLKIPGGGKRQSKWCLEGNTELNLKRKAVSLYS